MKCQFLYVVSLMLTSQQVLSQALSNELHPSWSPNGDRIVLYSDVTGNNEIFSISIAETKKTQITFNESSDENPVWSPSGDYVAFHSDRHGDFDIFIIRPDGTHLKRLTKSRQREMSPTWSPDGKEIIYEVDTAGNWQLFKVKIATNEITQLTFDPKDHLAAAVSNNDNSIFYGSSYRGAHQSDVEIFNFNPRDNTDVRITENSGVSSNVAFSANSDKVIFNTMRDGNWEIYQMNKDGTNPLRITTNIDKVQGFSFSDIDGQPSLSPDGLMIAFISGRDGSFDIFTTALDSRQLRNLTPNWYKK